MRVFLTYPGFGFDICSSIQEELQGREMASLSSMVKGSLTTLMKTKTHYEVRVYCIVRWTNEANTNYHTGSS